jgi:hypothetical protein
MSDMNQEFVSEDYDASAVNIEEIRREIEQLSSTKKIPGRHCSIIFSYCIKNLLLEELDESDWDKALADELENVSAEELENVSADDLEAQINQMLSSNNK